MTGLGELEYIKLAIYFASYLYFLAAPAALWVAVKATGAMRFVALGFLVVISCFAYGRFIEPRILLSPEHEISLDRCFADAGAVRIAVASDFHIGLFANAMPVGHVAARINAAAPDLAVMPGDFVYFLDPAKYEDAFAALATIKPPILAVLGNHDLGLPGPDVSGDLAESLSTYSVTLLDNRQRKFALHGGDIEVVGLSDDWAGPQKLDLLLPDAATPRIVVTHNPASVQRFTTGMKSDLVIGGHTHGGQVNLPMITCALTSMCGKRRYGLSRAYESYPRRRPNAPGDISGAFAENDTLIFTTSGTGMVGLPMRFRVPPRIDILNVSWEKCAPPVSSNSLQFYTNKK